MNLAILGSGPGGYVAAIKAAHLGARVTIIEEHEVGGACLNWGCIPTKILAASSDLLSKAQSCDEFGIDISGGVSFDLQKILARKDRIVGLQKKGILHLFAMHGISLVEGRGELVSPTEISVIGKNGTRQIVRADRIIVATGSRPYELPILPFDGKLILSTDDVFRLQRVPKRLIILGAGVSGCEFACIFRQFGTQVTIIEKLPRALPSEDIEISQIFERQLKKRGIVLLKEREIVSSEVEDDRIRIVLSDGQRVEADKLLICAGRKLNSSGIGAENIGLNRGACGEIVVNEKMETNISGMYAIGDVIGGHLLAHVASAEGIVAAKNCLGTVAHMDYRAVPSAIYTSPPIASVGIREQEAKDRRIPFRTGRFLFRTLATSHILGEIDGLIKVVAHGETDRVMGVHMIGPHAPDLIHEAALAISSELTTHDLLRVIHAHPTLSEVLQEAMADVHGEAIHAPKR